MNSTQIKIKKFLGNRNTVTILCAIIGIAVLFVGYTMTVNRAIEPVQVPYANNDIQPRDKITEDDISYMPLAKAALDKMKGSILTDKDDIINHYAATNSLIPNGSLFYSSAVVKERPNEAVFEAGPNMRLTFFKVSMDSSYVNSILPDNYIDIYASVRDQTTGMPSVGLYIQDVRVLSVKTADGENVFENTEEKRQPAYILVAVTETEFMTLMKGSGLGVTFSLIPTAKTKKDVEEESKMVSQDFEDYVNTRAGEFTYSGDNVIDTTTDKSGQDAQTKTDDTTTKTEDTTKKQ